MPPDESEESDVFEQDEEGLSVAHTGEIFRLGSDGLICAGGVVGGAACWFIERRSRSLGDGSVDLVYQIGRPALDS